ncbi:hypothetical protein BASA81_010364 [Batrachochytrium salamandrivorans]|nr:hypothetical protein BASA81_012847 [Batrachochytrium salamandrivorans]KAH9251694.1 hypothetical protein BASA81_010364 [Batrachochytrium salamandrivorans]
MDFGTLERDLEELQSDPKVRDALFSGVELNSYAADIHRQLQTLVSNSIPDYIKEAPETRALNKEIEECDSVLASIENILLEFQRDLGGISEEIRFLQDESHTMGVKLRNYRDVEERLSYFLEHVTLPHDLVREVCDTKDITHEFTEVTLRRLHERMQFVHDANFENPLLPMAPVNTAAAQDIGPELEKLKSRAAQRLKKFFLQRVQLLRSPNTNVQIIQKDLLEFRFGFEFLSRHAPHVAEEIKQAYAECMRTILFQLFKTYFTYMLRLVGKPGNDQHMTLGQRDKEIGLANDPPLILHLLPKNKQLIFESVFRSVQKHLVDSSTSEYLFLLEFFGTNRSNFTGTTGEMFDQVFSKTLQYVLDQVDLFLGVNQDVVAQLLLIKMSQTHRELMRTRTVDALDTYFDTLEQKLWPSAKRLIDANIKSLMQPDPRKMFGNAITPHTQLWTKKYALFASNVYCVAAELGEHSDGSIPRALDIARQKAMELLERMMMIQPDRKSQSVFMINNLDNILNTFHEVGRAQAVDVSAFEEALGNYKQQYVEEELQSCGFGRMIRFIKSGEKPPKPMVGSGGGGDKEVKDLISDFEANWRSGMDLVSTNVATNFANLHTGKQVLGMCLSQLCLYYQRFRELVQDHEVIKTTKIRLVEMSTLFAEVEKYSKAL